MNLSTSGEGNVQADIVDYIARVARATRCTVLERVDQGVNEMCTTRVDCNAHYKKVYTTYSAQMCMANPRLFTREIDFSANHYITSVT